VDRRTPGQDRVKGRPDRRVHRGQQVRGPGHGCYLSDPHLAAGQGRRVSPLQPVPGAAVGTHRLRRGPPAARPGVPGHR
jgi:hypothetical protein